MAQGKTSPESVAQPTPIPILCIAVRKLSGAAACRGRGRARSAGARGGQRGADDRPKPDLTTLVAQAKQLEFQINALSEQYDGLRIQLTRAQADAQIAEQAAARDAVRAGPAASRPWPSWPRRTT